MSNAQIMCLHARLLQNKRHYCLTIIYSSVVIKTILTRVVFQWVGALARYYAVVRLTFSFGCLASIFIVNLYLYYRLINQHRKETKGKKTLSLTGQGNQTLKLKNNPYRSTPFARYTYLVCIWHATVT